MSRCFIAIATVLSLGAGTSLALGAAPAQQLANAATQSDARPTAETIAGARLPAENCRSSCAKQRTTVRAPVPTPDYTAEPEAISRGTEP